MKTPPSKHRPRRTRARTLLAIAAGAALSASIAVGVAGCGDDTTDVNPDIGNWFRRPDMAVPAPDLRRQD